MPGKYINPVRWFSSDAGGVSLTCTFGCVQLPGRYNKLVPLVRSAAGIILNLHRGRVHILNQCFDYDQMPGKSILLVPWSRSDAWFVQACTSASFKCPEHVLNMYIGFAHSPG